MSRKTKDRRLKVLRLCAKGVSISDCARLAGVAYETARRYCREADLRGIEQTRKAPSFRTWPIELKTEVGAHSSRLACYWTWLNSTGSMNNLVAPELR